MLNAVLPFEKRIRVSEFMDERIELFLLVESVRDSNEEVIVFPSAIAHDPLRSLAYSDANRDRRTFGFQFANKLPELTH